MTEVSELLAIKESLIQKKSARDKALGKKETLMEKVKESGYSSEEDAVISFDKEVASIEQDDITLETDIGSFKETHAGLL